ncbi:MAG: GntR family transcriptional regulator, partial [Bacteroidota bacterium]
SKHEQIVQGIINAIDDAILMEGHALPSVNKMLTELGFARETIVKAYRELKERGIVESKNRMGYFVLSQKTNQTARVFLFLYSFDIVPRTFYEAFQLAIGENVQLDIFFHHNNLKVFETFLTNGLGKYGMYVVAPIHNERANELLRLIPPSKLLIVDRHEAIGEAYSYVTQLFEQPVYQALVALKDRILQFKEMILFYRDDTDFPTGTLKAFHRFGKDYKINYRVEKMYMPGTIRKGTVYYTINDADLWELLHDCAEHRVEIGQEIGILSQDDTRVKQFISGGITTITTDFAMMAQKAADYVLNREKIQEIIPSRLIRRNSL